MNDIETHIAQVARRFRARSAPHGSPSSESLRAGSTAGAKGRWHGPEQGRWSYRAFNPMCWMRCAPLLFTLAGSAAAAQ
jgi:hypothetical protein